jgi:hypothetical protein
VTRGAPWSSPTSSGSATRAVAWAREAGLQPDPAGVLAALKGKEVFAEESFFNLLTALGGPDLVTVDR